MSTEFFRKYSNLIAEAESSIIPDKEAPANDIAPDPIKPDEEFGYDPSKPLELGKPLNPFKIPKPSDDLEKPDWDVRKNMPKADPSTGNVAPPNNNEKAPADMSAEELDAEIARLEKELAYITPVDTEVDAGNGDKIMKKMSPRDLERYNKGIPMNKEIQRMPWEPGENPTGAKRQDLDAKSGSLPVDKPRLTDV